VFKQPAEEARAHEAAAAAELFGAAKVRGYRRVLCSRSAGNKTIEAEEGGEGGGGGGPSGCAF
jgi:hypothetical protein